MIKLAVQPVWTQYKTLNLIIQRYPMVIVYYKKITKTGSDHHLSLRWFLFKVSIKIKYEKGSYEYN
jgi:hypothetical protein